MDDTNQEATFNDNFPLPPPFQYDGMEVPYTAEQLAPTIERLEDAVSRDLGGNFGTPQQRLAAAWTRIAELRLPRKAVPNAVLTAVEDLVAIWDGYGQGGITRQAYALGEEELAHETARIEWMLAYTKGAAEIGFVVPVVPTE